MLFSLLRFYGRDALNVRTLAFVLTLFILTLLLMFSFPEQTDETSNLIFEPVSVSFVDLDQSIISYTLYDQFSNLDAVKTIHSDTLEVAQKRLERGEVLMIMIFPEDFYLDTVRGVDRGNVTVYLNEQMPTEATFFVRLLEDVADSVIHLEAALHAYADLVEPLHDDAHLASRHVEAATVDMAFRLVGRRSILEIDPDQEFVTVRHVISSIATLLAMLTSLLLISQVLQERQSGLHERLLIANVRPWRMVVAKQILLWFWLFIGFIPLLAFLSVFKPHARLLPMVVGLFLLSLTCSAWLMALAYRVTMRQTTLLVGWIIILVLALAGGAIYPFTLLPRWLQTISVLSPARFGYRIVFDELAGQSLRESAFISLLIFAVTGQIAAVLATAKARPSDV